jgi:hypothetical protein
VIGYTSSNGGPSLTARLDHPDSCIISVTAGMFYLSELAEQLAWLSATLLPSTSASLIARYPRIDSVSVQVQRGEQLTETVAATCTFEYGVEEMPHKNQDRGFCWTSLFGNAGLVGGYPILRRSQPKTGLEMSLKIMGFLVNSYQLVQCEERIIMKGFSSLLVATVITSTAVLWHTLISEQRGERISYFDTRLDALDLPTSEVGSLRDLETKRHIVGWCYDVEEFCG